MLKLVFFEVSERWGKKQKRPQPTKNLPNTVIKAKYAGRYFEVWLFLHDFWGKCCKIIVIIVIAT